MIPSERASQEEQNGANFSSIACSSAEYKDHKECSHFRSKPLTIVHGFCPKTDIGKCNTNTHTHATKKSKIITKREKQTNKQTNRVYLLLHLEGHSGGHVEQDFLRGGGKVRKCPVGTELPLQPSQIASVALDAHLEGGSEGGRGREGEGGREREGGRGVWLMTCFARYKLFYNFKKWYLDHLSIK